MRPLPPASTCKLLCPSAAVCSSFFSIIHHLTHECSCSDSFTSQTEAPAGRALSDTCFLSQLPLGQTKTAVAIVGGDLSLPAEPVGVVGSWPSAPPPHVCDPSTSLSLALECRLLTLLWLDNCFLALDFGEGSAETWIPSVGTIDAGAPPPVGSCGPIHRPTRWEPSLEHFCHLLDTGEEPGPQGQQGSRLHFTIF